MLRLYILTVLLLTSISAKASYYQENCSNGEQTVSVVRGQLDETVTLSERTYIGSTDQFKDKKFTLNINKEVLISYSYICNAEIPGKSRCETDWWNSMRDGQYTNFMKVSIRKADGSLFSENTMSVSEDKKSVVTILVCDGVRF